jgi:hypothetical protein
MWTRVTRNKTVRAVRPIADNIRQVRPDCYRYDVGATFNAVDLSFFYVGNDSRSNPFEERVNDVIQATPKDPLEVPVGLVTRLRVKRFKEAFNGLLRDT